MSERVITGAVISISVTPRGGTNQEIGRAMAMNIQEQYRVVPVYGIGRLHAQELPILQYAGGFSIQQFAFSQTALQNLMFQFNRETADDVQGFVRQLLYTDGVDVTIIRRQKVGANVENRVLAKIDGAICTSETMSIQENNIVVRDGSFVFANPVRA